MSNVKSFENGTILHASSSDTKSWTNNTTDRAPYTVTYNIRSNIQLWIILIPAMRAIHAYMRYSHAHTNGWKNRESYWSGQNRILPFLKLLWEITSTISAILRLSCVRVELILWNQAIYRSRKVISSSDISKDPAVFQKVGNWKTSTGVRRCKQGTGIINGMGKYSIFIFECFELYPKYSLTVDPINIHLNPTNWQQCLCVTLSSAFTHQLRALYPS